MAYPLSRTVVRLNHPIKQHKALIKHSQKKNIEFALTRLYNLFTIYLRDITKEMFSKNPLQIVGKAVISKNGEDKSNLTMTYADIIRHGSFDNIKDQIVSNIFRGFEELRSTTKLLEKVLKDTKANVPNTVTKEALRFLEMRHLFIHNKGLVDAKYQKGYGALFTPVLKAKQELPAKYEIFSEALKAVTVLIATIDSELIKHNMVEKRKAIEKKTP